VPLAAATVNKSLAVLKLVLRDAIEQGFLSESSALRVKYIRNRDDEDRMHILQPEEIERLFQVATGDEPWRTLYLLAVHTGLRRGELLGLHRGDLDAHTRCLYVRRGLNRIREGDRYVVRETPLKTKYSRRMIEDLSPTLIEALLALPASDDPARPYVFLSRTGGPIDPDNVDRAFKRHLDLAGLPEIRFHDLRHTHASLLIAAGVHPKAIQARLGHASITTTLDTYGHLMPSSFQGVGSRLEGILQGKLKTRTSVDLQPQRPGNAEAVIQ
jgi:integrase